MVNAERGCKKQAANASSSDVRLRGKGFAGKPLILAKAPKAQVSTPSQSSPTTTTKIAMASCNWVWKSWKGGGKVVQRQREMEKQVRRIIAGQWILVHTV